MELTYSRTTVLNSFWVCCNNSKRSNSTDKSYPNLTWLRSYFPFLKIIVLTVRYCLFLPYKRKWQIFVLKNLLFRRGVLKIFKYGDDIPECVCSDETAEQYFHWGLGFYWLFILGAFKGCDQQQEPCWIKYY